MTAIDVDFEVFKELTARRRSEAMTENDVLRELLGLSLTGAFRDAGREEGGREGANWVTKGVSFPHGTEFRATYKGQQYEAKVENGALELQGIRYTSPSAAAMAITGNPVNGWQFWEYRKPGSTRWRQIASARR